MTVTENPRRLEPVTDDPFIAGLEPTQTAASPATRRSTAVRLRSSECPRQIVPAKNPRPAERTHDRVDGAGGQQGRGLTLASRAIRPPGASTRTISSIACSGSGDEVQRREAAHGVEARVGERQRGRVAAHVAQVRRVCSRAAWSSIVREASSPTASPSKLARANARVKLPRPAADVEHAVPRAAASSICNAIASSSSRPAISTGANSGRHSALVDAEGRSTRSSPGGRTPGAHGDRPRRGRRRSVTGV